MNNIFISAAGAMPANAEDMGRTEAHELGHILINDALHEFPVDLPDAVVNFMTHEGIRVSPVYTGELDEKRVTEVQSQRMRDHDNIGLSTQ